MENITTDDNLYPRADIDPKLKNNDYLLAYARAMYNDWSKSMPKKMFAHAATLYEEIKSYALGKQNTAKYMPKMGVEGNPEDSWLNIDWRARSITSKFRGIGLGKIQKTSYNINFTPVDPTSQDEMSKYFADLKAKILLRQQLQQQQPELANSSPVSKQHGEPEDIDELQMQMDFGSKTNIAIDAEEAVQVIFSDTDNDINEHRKGIFEDLFNYGVSGFKCWIDENDRVRFRRCNMENIISSFCRRKDFKDAVHFGEIIEVPFSELAKHFNQIELDKIVGSDFSNKYQPDNTASPFNGTHDRFKAKVLDGQFITYDTTVKEQMENKKGNLVFTNTPFKNAKKDDKVTIKGKEEPKYLPKIIQTVYEFKWVIGTDYIYEGGIKKDQPRSTDLKKATKTSLDYHFYAPVFHNMAALGVMEQLLPMADEYQLLVYKIQNLNNRMMPFGWAINLDMIENVALGSGGEKMSKQEIIDMYFQTGILAYRQTSLNGDKNMAKAIEPIATSFGEEMQTLYNHMKSLVDQMQEISGLNQVTDGSSAGDDRKPVGIINSAQESTNNALFGIIDGEKNLLERLAMSCFRNLQIVLKRNKDYSGYTNALGSTAIKLIKVSPDLVDREMALICEDKPDDAQKQMLMAELKPNVDAGLLDFSDALIILDMYSVKKAYQILQYKINKNRKIQQQTASQQSQQNGQIQVQSAQAAEQAKQETLKLEWQLKTEWLAKQIEGQLAIQLEKNKSSATSDAIGAHAKITATAMGLISEDQIMPPIQPTGSMNLGSSFQQSQPQQAQQVNQQ